MCFKNHGALICICSHCFVHAVFSSLPSSRPFLQLPSPVSAVCELHVSHSLDVGV